MTDSLISAERIVRGTRNMPELVIVVPGEPRLRENRQAETAFCPIRGHRMSEERFNDADAGGGTPGREAFPYGPPPYASAASVSAENANDLPKEAAALARLVGKPAPLSLGLSQLGHGAAVGGFLLRAPSHAVDGLDNRGRRILQHGRFKRCERYAEHQESSDRKCAARRHL